MRAKRQRGRVNCCRWRRAAVTLRMDGFERALVGDMPVRRMERFSGFILRG
jgi:hypothetical protein